MDQRPSGRQKSHSQRPKRPSGRFPDHSRRSFIHSGGPCIHSGRPPEPSGRSRDHSGRLRSLIGGVGIFVCGGRKARLRTGLPCPGVEGEKPRLRTGPPCPGGLAHRRQQPFAIVRVEAVVGARLAGDKGVGVMEASPVPSAPVGIMKTSPVPSAPVGIMKTSPVPTASRRPQDGLLQGRWLQVIDPVLDRLGPFRGGRRLSGGTEQRTPTPLLLLDALAPASGPAVRASRPRPGEAPKKDPAEAGPFQSRDVARPQNRYCAETPNRLAPPSYEPVRRERLDETMSISGVSTRSMYA